MMLMLMMLTMIMMLIIINHHNKHDNDYNIKKDLNISSIESQKGVIAAQRCSVENQKGAIVVQMAIAPFLSSTEHLQ